MSAFKGVNLINEIEAKVAPIIEDFYLRKGTRNFLVWLQKNNIECVSWWDYSKNKDIFESIPFVHFRSIFEEKQSLTDVWNNKWNDWEHSLRYLLIPKEMALKILCVGYIA